MDGKPSEDFELREKGEVKRKRMRKKQIMLRGMAADGQYWMDKGMWVLRE